MSKQSESDTGASSHEIRVALIREELLEDRELATARDDRLQHAQIAQQLADLAMTVSTPTNIALFGAWGSGKSGIGNLVKERLQANGHLGKHGSAAFARFDAFKYAENPLRRNFVSAMASELCIHDDQFHADLYTGKTTTGIKLPISNIARLAILFVAFLAAVMGIIAAVCLLIAAMRSGNTLKNFGRYIKTPFAATLAPAALLAAFVALGGKTFNVEKRLDRADSHEQFEDLFRKLVKQAGKKVVVFVDELDRCSPSNVVATLDALRTFLGVSGCVFIVAADRQVLEQALSTDLQQATPRDTVNPYYSEGSSYLDKVFQYELTVPPLLRHSVTRFAIDLVRNRAGLWSELQDLELVVSVLVPSHVRSPRRVKGLLNSFSLAYRLAEARQGAGLLNTDVKSRADEIARLVCLRTEFPLFAQHLVTDYRLPTYVLMLHEQDEEAATWAEYPLATGEIRDVAKRFAELKASVATLASRSDIQSDGDQPNRPDDGVERKAGQQLLDYLSRTRSVRGPGRDLIHLQTTGSVVGLESDLAERIENLASNGSVPQVEEIVQRLDSAQAQGVLGLLIEQARGAIGVESVGVARTLLALAGSASVGLSEHGATIADAIVPALDTDPNFLRESDLAGAWRLGLSTTRASGRRLQKAVLDSPEVLKDKELGLLVLQQADAALIADKDRTTEILTKHLCSDDTEATCAVLAEMPTSTTTRLLRASGENLAEALRALPSAEAVAPAATTAAGTPTVQAAAPEPVADDVFNALTELLSSLEPGPDGPAQALAGVLLTVASNQALDTVEARLDTIGEIVESELAIKILSACSRRHASRWPRWLRSLRPTLVSDPAFVAPLQKVADALWAEATKLQDRATDAQLSAAAVALASLLDERPHDQWPSLTVAVEAELGDWAQDDLGAQRRVTVLQHTAPLLQAGLISHHTLTHLESLAAIETFALPLALATADSPLVQYLEAKVNNAVADAPNDADLPDLLAAAYACTWLPRPASVNIPLQLRAAAEIADTGSLPALPTVTEMTSLWTEVGDQSSTALSSWLALTPSQSAGLSAIAECLVDNPASSSVLAALGKAVEALPKSVRNEPLRAIVDDPATKVPAEDLLNALGARDLPNAEVVSIITQRSSRAVNNPQRKDALELWRRVSPSSEAARRELIEKVLVPMFTLNNQAASTAFDYLEPLCSPLPAKVKRQLGEAVNRAVGQGLPKKKAEERMKKLGYKVTKSGGIFGFGASTRIDPGEPAE